MLEHGMYTYHYLVLNSHVNICLHVETSHISMMLIIKFHSSINFVSSVR